MLATESQRSYPKYGIATLIVLLLFIGVPYLLITFDPGAGDDLTVAGEVIASPTGITYTAPAGWDQRDVPGAVVLRKGAAIIELRQMPWTGTPAELYADNGKKLGEATKVISLDDPSPTTINGMPAVEGKIHMVINGADTSGYMVAATNGTDGLVADLFGPLLDINQLRDEYRQVLSTLSISAPELEQ